MVRILLGRHKMSNTLVPREIRLSRIMWMMALTVVTIGALAYWDARRESVAGINDFANEQATLAQALALIVKTNSTCGAQRADLLSGAIAIERPASIVILLRRPGADAFAALDGGRVTSGVLDDALRAGRPFVRLERRQAAELGLPERTAFAGLAQIDVGEHGTWGVASVASAERLRDREYRSGWRLFLTTLTAGGLAFAFGGFALRRQRVELELARELAVAEAQGARDERLARLSRTATLGTMAMGIAHEISTPLGIIGGRADQLVSRPQEPDKVERNAKTILAQTQRIGEIIRAFLALARGDAAPVRQVSAAAVAEEAEQLTSHVFAKAGVSFTRQVAPSLPPIRGDARLLEHAVVNLLLNACHASARGGHVVLSVETEAQALSFVVLDDGQGISPAYAQRVTEPFFSTKPAGEGAGLGLAIVAEIVKSHHGKLSLAPRAPRGTRACIQLPIAQGEMRDA